jgi:hypothetical protein
LRRWFLPGKHLTQVCVCSGKRSTCLMEGFEETTRWPVTK